MRIEHALHSDIKTMVENLHKFPSAAPSAITGATRPQSEPNTQQQLNETADALENAGALAVAETAETERLRQQMALDVRPQRFTPVTAGERKLPLNAKPMSSFLINVLAPPSLGSISVQHDDDGKLIINSAQARASAAMTCAKFCTASMEMRRSDIYADLDIGLFHDAIVKNLFDEYTPESIIRYEQECRQLVHRAPPGTKFQEHYAAQFSLYLVTKDSAALKQLLTSSTSQRSQQRSGQPGNNNYNNSSQQQRFGGQFGRGNDGSGNTFPPCQNFAQGECVPYGGGTCSRNHACLGCNGKAYPLQRACPAGHRGEEVSRGIMQAIERRLAFKRRNGGYSDAPDSSHGGGKRQRGGGGGGGAN